MITMLETGNRIFSGQSNKDVLMKHADNLISYIDDLILDNAIRDADGWNLHFYDLDDDEQGKLVAFKIKENKNDVGDLYCNDHLTYCLLTFLNHYSPFNSQCLAENIREQAISYFSNELQDLIDERCAKLRSDRLDARGFDE